MRNPEGESDHGPLRPLFDRRLKLEFHGSRVTSDAGLLAYRELDDALGLTALAGGVLADSRTGRNGWHGIVSLLRQSVYGRLAGYEDVNDADRLGRDPAMRWIVGGKAVERGGTSTSQMGRFETGGVVQAAAPAVSDRGGLPTEGVLAHVLISKYGDHLPLYRQSQIYARLGLDLHRATLADWVGKASFHLRPVVDCLAAELKTSGKLGVDETTIRVLDPGRGRTKTGYMWTMVRDERPWSGADPPGVVYCYAPGRGGKHGEKLLAGFSGTAQIDGYSGYNRLRRSDRPGGALRLANCWAHARRGLREIFDSSGSVIAKAGLDRIARLYAIEERIRGEPAATRQAIRWTESAPLVNAFGVWLDEQRSRVSPRSRLGEKLTYIANQWDGLLVFLYDGRVEIDSNFVENRIRPLKLTAKNALFAGHDEGAAAWGRIASLIETCKMNRVEPYAWLKSTLEKIAAGHPQSKIHELLPWNFEPETD